ncbi:MAG: ABC transporter permease [Thiobacillaceae bacterium]|nr:ABC transporter permease [Thiobacillaceae bacterium]
MQDVTATRHCRWDADQGRLCLQGHWTLAHLAAIDADLKALPLPVERPLTIDGSALVRLDSVAANRLLSHLQGLGADPAGLAWVGFGARERELITLVAERRGACAAIPLPHHGLRRMLGWHVFELGRNTVSMLAFVGRVAAALGELVRRPTRLRLRELTVQLEMVGLRAIPLIIMMNWLIGVVFAYLLGIQVQKFGANVFVVDGVGLAITRELAPLITAVLVAGRSGAAFTAHLGAMRVNQETDAIAVLGLSPWQVLVLPRLLALLVVLPLLTALGDVAGILGAALVADWHLGVTPTTFFERLQERLPLATALFGLSKAPVFALVIGLIACHNGMTVARDARSVGLATTATVVHSIVMVILIDAAFAVAYPEIK